MSSPSPRQRLRLSFKSPVVLSFAGICIAVQILNLLTSGASNRLWFSVERAPLGSLRTWARLVLHVFGHADWDHLLSNMMYFLILGPMLEEKYGGRSLITVMAATAVVTGALTMLLFPHVRLLGASGIVFSFILLSSITIRETRTIPLTFVLVALLYIGVQIYEGLFVNDSVSQITHIAGGVVGSCLGFVMNERSKWKARRES